MDPKKKEINTLFFISLIKIYQNISRSCFKREDILVIRIALNVAERFDNLATTTFNQTMDPKKRKKNKK
jgi:hypothetical protein